MSGNPQIKLGATNELYVVVRREMFSEFFTLELPDGSTEELDTEETYAWFKERGADMDAVDKALTHIWNFLKGGILIKNPKTPRRPVVPHAPQL